MSNVELIFQNVEKSARDAYDRAFSRNRFRVMSKSDKHFLMQEATGILMEKIFYSLVESLEIKNIVECGAHDATTSRRFINQTKGKALAFEANPFVFERISSLPMDKNLQYFNVGLSNKHGVANLNIPIHHVEDSSLEASLDIREDIFEYTKVEININTLDNLALEFVKEKKCCLWIDVEGLGGVVLEGSHDILAQPNTRMIYIEVQDDGEYYKNEKTALNISRELAKFGFFPIAKDYPKAKLYNLIFIRKEDLPNSATLVSNFWLECAKISIPIFRYRSLRDLASIVKKRFLISDQGGGDAIHRILATLGSKSSQKILKVRKTSH